MKKSLWVASGLLMVLGLPVLLVLEAMVMGGPRYSDHQRSVVSATLLVVPVTWVAALILSIIESRRGKRARLLLVYRILPFAVWAVNPLTLLVVEWSNAYHGSQSVNKRAIAQANVDLATTPAGADSLFRRATSHGNLGHYDDAIADFSAVIRLQPTNAAAYYGRGFAYELKKESDRAIADYNEAIRHDPNNFSAHRQRSYYYRDQRDFARAIAECDEMIRLEPGNVAIQKNRAFYHESNGNFDAAIADYTELIRRGPDNEHLLYFSRAAVHLRKNDFDAAIADYTEFIRLSSPQTMASLHLHEAYGHRADVHARKRDHDRAIADFTEAIRLKPLPLRTAGYLAGRGLAYTRTGALPLAVADLTEAARLNPNDHVAYHQLARLLATATDARVKDGPLAVTYAQKACELTQWQNATYLDTLALTYAETGKFDEAVKWGQKCLELPGPDNGRIGPRQRLETYRKKLADQKP